MSAVELVPAPSHYIGPTWRRRAEGGWWLPQYSLGWDVLDWLSTYVTQPSGPHAGEPFIPTLEQARFLLWWYAVDSSGRFAYRKGILRRQKGWGKDPCAAAMSLAELCGPVVLSHWAPSGEPVGKPHSAPWIQVAAVSQDQTRNTFTLFPAMASKRLREEYGLDLNKTIIFSKTGGIIEAVTASPLSMEGKRPSFVIKNETQWWLENNSGHEMANVIAGNVDKAAYGGCRVLSICNAHVPGQESDAEQDWDAYQQVQAGNAVDTGVLYDALEAPADTDLTDEDSLRRGLEIARGDATWLDVDTLVQSIQDIRNPASESRRKFLNQINAAEDSWLAPHEWDACRAPELRPLEAKDAITLGFDGSRGDDWSALVACRIEDAAVFVLKTWNPESYNGEIPREDVNRVVEWAFGRFKVVAFRADVREFEAYVDQWGSRFGKKLKQKATPKHPVGYDMRSNQKYFTLDCERFENAVLEGELVHDGAAVLRQHVLNAHRRPNNHGVTIGKASKDSSRKIDAAVCAVLAFGARQEFIMSKRYRRGGAVIFR